MYRVSPIWIRFGFGVGCTLFGALFAARFSLNSAIKEANKWQKDGRLETGIPAQYPKYQGLLYSLFIGCLDASSGILHKFFGCYMNIIMYPYSFIYFLKI